MGIFDWPSIRSNLISDFIFLLISFIITPVITVYFLKLKSRKTLVQTLSHILLEFCDFLSYTNYRDNTLNSEHIEITTKRSKSDEYRFVAISIVNVFNPVIYPRLDIVVYNQHQKNGAKEAYEIVKSELTLLKELRIEIEKILSSHALYLDEKIIIQISDLCFKIRTLEITHKTNEEYERLSTKFSKQMTGVFGTKEIQEIYKTIFRLMRTILERKYFDFSVTKLNQ